MRIVTYALIIQDDGRGRPIESLESHAWAEGLSS